MPPATTQPRADEICARCGASFECGMKSGIERCWCAELPPIAPERALGGCLCPRCLRDALAATNEQRE
jgi:ribosomal protein L34E